MLDGAAIREKHHAEWAKENAYNHNARWRKYHLKNVYGITPEDYERMLDEQNGVCAICGESCPTGRLLSVDHDHNTGQVRGLLCSRCNFGIGSLRTVKNIKAALRYLKNGK